MSSRLARLMSFVVFIFFGCSQMDILAQGMGAVVVDRVGDSVFRGLYHTRMFEQLKIIDTQEADKRRAKYTSQHQPFHDPPEFRRQAGYVYSLTQQGIIQKMGFLTVSSQQAFKQYAQEMIRRSQSKLPQGQELQVVHTTDRLEIAEAPLPDTRPPGPNGSVVNVSRTLNALKLKYYPEGIIVGGGSGDITEINFSKHEFRRVLARAKGKTRFVSIRPDEIPVAVRSQLIETLERSVLHRLQKRDDEQTTEHSFRRQNGKVMLSFLNSIAFEVDSATAWTKWPESRNEPFVARAELKPKPNTELEKLIKSLRPVRGVPRERKAIATVNTNVRLNERLSALLMLLNASADWSKPLKRTLDVLLQARELSVRVDLVNDDGEPGIVASSRIEQTSRQKVNELRTQLENESGITVQLYENSLRLSNLADMPEVKQDPSMENPESSEKPGTLLHVQANLQSLATEDLNSQGRRLAKSLERLLMDHWKYRAFSPENRARQRYPRMWKYGDPTGDWTLDLKMRVVNGTLIADCHIGNELFSWFTIRML